MNSQAHRRIDIHAHLAVESADELMMPHMSPAKEPAMYFADDATRAVSMRHMAEIRCKLTSTAQRIADMDTAGIDIQVLSPSPHQYYYWAEPELGNKAARLINDELAKQVRARADRFAGLGTLPLQDAERSVCELHRCLDELGLCGFEIGPHVAGMELDDPRLEVFFSAAEAREAFLFLHPLGFTHGERLRKFHFNNVIGNPLESAIALGHLIMGGVLERHPKLRLCVAHGGGYLPAYSGRMDHAWQAREDCRRAVPRKPSEYLSKLYFDTVVHSVEQIEYLVARYGAGQLMLGSDYPFDMGESSPLSMLEASTKLSSEERRAIAGANAASVLRIEASRTVSHELAFTRSDRSARSLARGPYELGLRELARGMYAYTQPDGSWGLSNAGLIVDADQSLLVDTLFDLPLTAAMLASMRRAEPKATQRIDTLVNTHANPDHTHGNILVKGAEIIASVRTARGMEALLPEHLAAMMHNARANVEHSAAARFLVSIFGKFELEGIEPCMPTREFEGELTVRVGDTQVNVYEVGAAHTESDVIVFVPSAKTVFTGDILFIGGHPVMWTGPVKNWLRACDRILALDVEWVVPGHGPVTDKLGVQAVRDYLAGVYGLSQQFFTSGVSAKVAALEIAKAIDLSGYRSWGEAERLVATVSTIYRELSQDPTPADAGAMFVAMAEFAAELSRR